MRLAGLTYAEAMDIDQIWRIAADIPPEWYEFDTLASSPSRSLYSRRSAFAP